MWTQSGALCMQNLVFFVCVCVGGGGGWVYVSEREIEVKKNASEEKVQTLKKSSTLETSKEPLTL